VPDLVSWFVIERGWKVLDAEGNEVGRVEEIVGDSGRDIFNGLTIATGLFARGQYVPAEEVAEITEGRVRLTLRKDDVDRLPEYSEPPRSEQIRPE
jgi:uncharacterized protein YrrD